MLLKDKDENVFTISRPQKNGEEFKNLPSGVYKIDFTESLFGRRYFFKEFAPVADKLSMIEGGVFQDIYENVTNFFSARNIEISKDFGIKHKSGSILYGPPGTGKTSLIYLCAQALTKLIKPIVLYTNVEGLCELAQYTREDATIPLIVILEELDNEVGYKRGSSSLRQDLLNFLDGFDSVDNIYVFATTNHIDDLPKSFTERPSRFERKWEIDCVPQEVAIQVIKSVTPVKYHELINVNKIAFELTEKHKLRIDAIKHIMVNVVRGMNPEDAVALFNFNENK